MIVTENNFPEFARYIEKFDEKLSIDTETTGLRLFTRDVVAGVSVYNGEKAFYAPVRHALQTNITPDQYKTLSGILSKVKIHVGHNTPFDRHALSRDGASFNNKVIDTQPGAQLLDENGSLKLKNLADRYLNKQSSQAEKELNKKLDSWGFNKGEMWRLPPEIAGPYAEQDAILCWDLATYLQNTLPPELLSIWQELNEFSEILRGMEALGILIDVERMAQRKREAQLACYEIQRNFQAKFGNKINLNAPAQIARLFALKNADEATLTRYKHIEGINDVLNYRAYNSAICRYYNKYPEFIDAFNVIHSHYNITGTETGRLSSSDPNLTAVPRWCEEQKVKDVFISRPNTTLIEADYSQAEIRVAAHYTQDAAVLAIFENGLDYHTETANKLGIERQKAKVLNLAINYGAGVGSLVEQLDWPEKKVKDVLREYHNNFPGFRKTSKICEKTADERGFVKYWTGRRRHFDPKYGESRKAFNSIVQGGTAEMVRRVMDDCVRKLQHAKILLQVHDSLMFEVPDELVTETIPKIREIMEYQPWCKVPMKVDIKTGKRWSEMKAV